MKIRTHIPYHPEKDLAAAYNDYMSRLGEGEWACFLDHDAMFTTTDWYLQMDDVIGLHPEVACFTAVTNRIWKGAKGQLYQSGLSLDNHDVAVHRKVGAELRDQFWGCVEPLPKSQPMSGFLILYNREI